MQWAGPRSKDLLLDGLHEAATAESTEPTIPSLRSFIFCKCGTEGYETPPYPGENLQLNVCGTITCLELQYERHLQHPQKANSG